MAITTGAADAGVLNLDVGSRPRAGNAGNGDSFANALDTQMHKPRTEQSRAEARPKSVPKGKEPVAKGKNEQEPPAREGGVAEEKPVAKGEEGADEAARTEEVEPSRSLVAILLQAAPEPGSRSEDPAIAAGTPGEGGKELPLPETDDAAAALLSTGGAPKTGVVTGTAADAVVNMSAARSGEPVAPATDLASFESPVLPKGDPLAQSGVTRAGDSPAARAGTDGFLQLATGTAAAAPEGGKADAFAATLAALREAAPRGGGDATAPLNTTAGAAAPPPAPATPPANSAAPNLPAVNVPVGQNGWDQVVGERVLWMTRQGMQEAKIELNPRDLGPIEVRVSVQQDQANVSFTAQNPAAREALEAAMPRLREMLADNGLNLAQSDVSQRSPQQQESGWGNNEGQRASGGNQPGIGGEEQASVTLETPATSLGAVDYYA